MIIAVVLSAGESSRMGRLKALLPIKGQNFIERIIRVIGQSRIRSDHRCLGSSCRSVARQNRTLPVEVVINPDYRSGQLSSLQAAIRHISDDDRCGGMLVHLVDHPFIDVALVDALIEEFLLRQKK